MIGSALVGLFIDSALGECCCIRSDLVLLGFTALGIRCELLDILSHVINFFLGYSVSLWAD